MLESTITKRGLDLLRDPRFNKGTAFTQEERAHYGLTGLLPHMVTTAEQQMARIEQHIVGLPTDLDRYVYFSDLQERNESLFYRILMNNPKQYMPVVYTPTVGLACQTFGRIYRRPKGLFVSAEHRGNIVSVLRNWPIADVRFVCVTDGERILGLGDLGAQGMGIPVGKLALYTTCAGVPPELTLPIVLDVGTNNEDLRNDPFYIGMRTPRLQGSAYDDFVDEFVSAIEEVFPECCIQWEDFANHNAVPVLERYRHRVPSFNDDIQGTAAVGVAGVLSALRLKGENFTNQTFLFFGAGSAGIGIADLLCKVMMRQGISEAQAQRQIYLFDSKGLVIASRNDITNGKKTYAHDVPMAETLLDAVVQTKATAIIGTSTIPNSFTPEVLRAMAANTKKPIVFPYSNPTSKSECTAEDAYSYTNGACIFASGSPFLPVTFNGQTYVPSQGNNVYIFPAIGLAVLAANPRTIPDATFVVAAEALAAMVTNEQFAQGFVYPPIDSIRESSLRIAVSVAEYFFNSGLARVPKPPSIEAHVQGMAWQPEYQ
jgi:malate dehydrogenase (oxaloacetate-decarboxylating)(NADP+)